MRIFLFFMILLLHLTGSSQTTLYSESFETDGEGTRYVSNTFSLCSGSPGNNPDYFLRTNTNPVLPTGCTAGFGNALTNLQGSWFWASEDIRSSSPVPNAFPPGSIITQSINISNYGTLTVSLYLATASNNNTRWETSDSINIQASINNGAFITVGRFVGDNISGGRLRIDADLDGVGEGTAVDASNFQQYTFSIPGGGNTLQVRLDFDQIGGTEELAIDLIEVKGNLTLPLSLLKFNAVLQNDDVLLNWLTVNEENTSHFEIERSNDAITFTSIGNILSANTPGNDTYSFTDSHPFTGYNYYRLKMIDKDGKYTFSQVVKVINDKRNVVMLYPNPATIDLNIHSKGRQEIFISDVQGRIFQKKVLQNGNNLLDVSKLLPGMYFVHMENGQTIKWIRQE